MRLICESRSGFTVAGGVAIWRCFGGVAEYDAAVKSIRIILLLVACLLGGRVDGFAQDTKGQGVAVGAGADAGAPPVITSMTWPTNVSVAYGERLNLAVTVKANEAGGRYPITYRWWRNGFRLQGTLAPGADSSNLTAKVRATATYSVTVSNAFGGTNLSWRVSVFYPGGVVISQQPVDRYEVAGGKVSFWGGAVGSNTLSWQWKRNGVEIAGATNTTLTLDNVSAADEGIYNLVATDGVHTCTSSNASFNLVRPPVIRPLAAATNLTCLYGRRQELAVDVAAAAGQTNGFPLTYRWQHEGTNFPAALGKTYAFMAGDDAAGRYTVTVVNAAGSASASWQVTVTNAVKVADDLLLIYNTNSADSKAVLDYYLAHRPNIAGANVLGIGYQNRVAPGYYEPITPVDLTNCLLNPVAAWLDRHPGKQPQYVVLFLDVPGRVCADTAYPVSPAGYAALRATASVGVKLRAMREGWQPYVTHLNMGMANATKRTEDCIAYIDKLARLGVPVSPGSPVLSASAGGYHNTQYILDGVRGKGYANFGSVVAGATNELGAGGVSPGAIQFYDGVISNYDMSAHCLLATNLAGYVSWGVHGYVSAHHMINGSITWSGNSGWYLMQTIESYNGEQIWLPGAQGTFTFWFSPTAFGGKDYANTPAGAVSSVEEPSLGGKNNNAVYFGLWARGKVFGICAWASAGYGNFCQATGDPLICR